MPKIMLVDDQSLVRSAITRLLAEHPELEIVAEAHSAEAALLLIPEHNLDLILMDLHMPGIGGIPAILKIRSLYPQLKIMVLSAHIQEPQLSAALQAGARGYLSKGATPEQMLQAIRSVLSGKIYLEPTLAQTLALHQSSHGSKSPLQSLSQQEKNVFEQIVQGVDTAIIATQLGIHLKTLNTYRYRIYDKLQVDNDVQLMLLALRYGLIGGEPQPEPSAH